MTVALLVTCAITGRLRWRRGPLLSYAAVTAVLVDRGHRRDTRALRHGPLPEYSKDAVLASMQLLREPVEATVARTPSPAPGTSLPPLETIQARKVLRVGYLPDALPFAFFNRAGDWWASTSSSRTISRAISVSAWRWCPSIARRWRRSSQRGIATW